MSATRDNILVPYTKSQQLAEHLPNARLLLVPEGEHVSTVTNLSTFNSGLIDFIKDIIRE